MRFSMLHDLYTCRSQIIKNNCHKIHPNMEQNNTLQHKSFFWHLDFEPFTWKTCYGEQCPTFVTGQKYWQTTKKIKA